LGEAAGTAATLAGSALPPQAARTASASAAAMRIEVFTRTSSKPNEPPILHSRGARPGTIYPSGGRISGLLRDLEMT
jgi:hypothetical protein